MNDKLFRFISRKIFTKRFIIYRNFKNFFETFPFHYNFSRVKRYWIQPFFAPNLIEAAETESHTPKGGIVHGCLGSSWRRPKKQTDIGFLWIHPSSSPSLRPPPRYSTSSLPRPLSPFLPFGLTSFPRRSSFLVSSGFHLFLNISRSRHRFGHQSLALSWCLTLCAMFREENVEFS